MGMKGIFAAVIIIIIITATIIYIGITGKNNNEEEKHAPVSNYDAGVAITGDEKMNEKKHERPSAAPISTYDESLIGDTVDEIVHMTDEEWAAIPKDEIYEDPKADTKGTWDPESGSPPAREQAMGIIYDKVTSAAEGTGIFAFSPEIIGEPLMNDKGGFTCRVRNANGTSLFEMETDSEGKVYTKLIGSLYNEKFPGVIYNTDLENGDTGTPDYAEKVEGVLIDNAFYIYVLEIETADDNEAYLHDMDGERYHIIFNRNYVSGNGMKRGELYRILDDGTEVDPEDVE